MTASEAESGRTAGWDRASIEQLIDELWRLRSAMVAYEAGLVPRLKALAPHFAASARNLAHYFALRRVDIRPLQGELARIGVSSLGRAETHVLANLDKVLGILHRLADRPCAALVPGSGPPTRPGTAAIAWPLRRGSGHCQYACIDV